MCAMHTEQRQANLLGAFSLAVTDRVGAAVRDVAPSAGEGPAGLVAAATFLEGGSIEDLSQALGRSHSATVRLIDKLELRGLLERRGADDARSWAIVATESGGETARRILDARVAVLAELLEPLSPSERGELSRLLEKLLGGLASSGAERRRICRLCDCNACGHESGHCPVTEAPRGGTPGR
jgi:MarR family transcriptional repressor of emrRAB